MPVIVFIILPFPSHYLACFEFAREWKERGYAVIFTGVRHHSNIVENEGFRFYPFEYLSEYTIRSVKTFMGLFLKTLVDPLFTKSRFREFIRSKIVSETLFETVKPEKIFLDEHLAEYYWFFKKYNCEISLVNTKLSTTKRKGIPPLDSGYMPSSTYFSHLYSEILWKQHFFFLWLQEISQFAAFFGKDEIFFWKRLCRSMRYKWESEISRDKCFYRGVKTLKTTILAPALLDFPGTIHQQNESHFYKSMRRNEQQYITKEYEEVRGKIKNRTARESTIYIAFGTLTTATDRDIIQSFIYRLLKFVNNRHDLLFVMPRNLYPVGLKIKSNILLIEYAPQIDLLNYVDVMISAGGLGTIKECYDAKVPMLILPTNKKGDHSGNGARVQINGNGLIGDLNSEPIDSIYYKLSFLLDKKRISGNCNN